MNGLISQADMTLTDATSGDLFDLHQTSPANWL